MTDINKQTFLAELGKLLTFMYEEDRQRAVAMYAKMFEDAPDEQALLQVLGSPTRQAVNVARAYNAKERKLQVEAQTREVRAESGSQETPDYVLVINKIYQEAVPAQTAAEEPLEDQFSLFDEMNAPEEDEAEESTPAEEAPVENEPVSEAESEPQPEEAAAESEEPAEEEPEESQGEAPAPEAESEEQGEEAAESASATQDEVDAFIAEFIIENDELAEPEPEAAPAPAESEPVEVPQAAIAEEIEFEPEEVRLVRKPRVFLLILYILLAVPFTLLGLVILLIPTLVVLALALVVISAGSALAFTAFTGFSILADILIVSGAALIVLGLGLLVLWTFVWFIGGPIAGLIRGVCSLGRKWCYKEVAA